MDRLIENMRCEICSGKMILQKKSTVKSYVPTMGLKNMRKCRFICEVPGCGYQTTIYGDGMRDLETEPASTIEEIKIEQNKQAKNQER